MDYDWRKSTYSGANGGNCVEVAPTGAGIAVRDTKDRGHGPVLRVTPAAWDQFLTGVKGKD
jgi:hypothetical protein